MIKPYKTMGNIVLLQPCPLPFLAITYQKERTKWFNTKQENKGNV